MGYYDTKQYVARVNKKDTITGKVEKWEAHTKGVMHRGFTVGLIYENKVILQHRKHPAFDGVYDLTLSSHPVYRGGALQSDEAAIYEALSREWDITAHDLDGKLKFQRTVWYKAKDPNSKFVEHEMDRYYFGHIKRLPRPNFEFSYGYILATLDEVKDKKNPIHEKLAPWVAAYIK